MSSLFCERNLFIETNNPNKRTHDCIQIPVEHLQNISAALLRKEGSIDCNGNDNSIVVTKEGAEAVQIDGWRYAKGQITDFAPVDD